MVDYQFLTTVNQNKQAFSKRATRKAKKAQELYGIVQYPSLNDVKTMMHYNMIKDCPVSREDVENMVTIYGPDIGTLKGKITRKKSLEVKSPDYAKYPQ